MRYSVCQRKNVYKIMSLNFTEFALNELKKVAMEKGLTIWKACTLIGVRWNTFYEWKAGKHSPTLSKVQEFYDAIDSYDPTPKKGGRNRASKTKE